MMAEKGYPQLKLIGVLREGELQAKLIENYSRAVTERMLPALQLSSEETNALVEFDLEIQKRIEESCEHPIEAGFYPNYEFGTFSDFGEYSQSRIMRFETLEYAQMEAATIYFHALCFFFVSLFHLFERQLISTLSILDYRNGGAIWKPFKVRTFNEAEKILGMGGYPLAGDSGDVIRRLRLIANAIKHGNGRSLQELAKAKSALFRGVPMGATTTLDHLNLDQNLFSTISSALIKFWIEFPTDSQPHK